jgi:hypothetical protein
MGGQKNEVTLTFAGDSEKLESAFAAVGESADKMNRKVGESTKTFDDTGSGMGRLGDKADTAESNLIGVHDIIDGTATIMQGPGKVGLVGYIQGWADLAGGIAPVLSNLAQTKVAVAAHAVWSGIASGATKIWAGTQWLLNAAFIASPIGWIVLAVVALIAVVVLIATKTNWFQTIWRVTWTNVKRWAVSFWDWIKNLPGMLGGAFRGLVNIITWPWRTAFNFIARAWNNTVGRLSFTLPSWIPKIGGAGFSMPQLPTFHSGGTVPGAPGSEMLAILQAGEHVTPAGQSSPGRLVVSFPPGGSTLQQLMITYIRTAIRDNSLQLAVSNGRVAVVGG